MSNSSKASNLPRSAANTIYLIDGSSYLYRAYHALPPLSNSHGEPTGAVFGVANMLRKLLLEHKPEYIAVVFDAKGKNFRHELYKEYKAHRPPMPDDLRVQIEPLHDLIKAMGLPLVCIPGVEADDVIATLAVNAEQQGWHAHISTIDKDIMQLVNNNIKIYNDMTKTEFDLAAVEQKFGVPSSLIVDYLALVGDKADNVPGVPGVGPKTACKWLNEYGSLDELMNNAHLIKNKAGQNLRDNLEQLPLSKQLVTLKTDVALELDLVNFSCLKKKTIEKEHLITSLEALSFKSWLNDEVNNKNSLSTANLTTDDQSADNKNSNNNSDSDTAPNGQYHNYKIITDNAELKKLTDLLKSCQTFCFDTETTSLNTLEAKLVGISLAVNNDSFYIPFGHIDSENHEKLSNQLDHDYALKALEPIFNNKKITKIAQNLKYDLSVLKNYNFNIAPPYQDTMLQSYVYNSTASKHDLDTLAYNILEHQMIKYEDICGKGAKQVCFSTIDIETAAKYAAEDALVTLKIFDHFNNLLQQDKKLNSVYTDIELPLVSVLSKMERKGVLIDCKLLNTQSKQITATIESLTNKIYTTAKQEFNIDSPKQLQEVLYNQLGLPVLEKTPTKQPSTAESALEQLSLDYPIAKDILEYRSLKKLKSTYIDRLPEQIDTNTKRIHTSFHQAVTATGRLSSSSPNLQNIPIRTEEGRKIRKAFVAPRDYLLISCDYSQVELRIMAHLSQDKSLLKAFSNDEDIHSFTASEIFGISLDDVTSEHRRHAKAINFGLIYGMSAYGLARQLGIDNNDAKNYMDLYFARYPGVQNYMETTRKLAEKQGFVETIFGRRLYLPNIKTKNFAQRRAMERMAINAPMQGSAADIIKKAMIAVDTNLSQDQKLAVNSAIILQVHDELIIEVHQDYAEQAKKIVIDSMQNAAKLSVPLKVSCNIGKNWDEAH